MKTKVLFLAESLNVGGAEKALVSLLSRLDYSRYDVTLKLISLEGAFISDLSKIHGLRIEHLVRPSEFTFSKLINAIIIKSIYKWLSPEFVGWMLCRNYDVVVAFCEGYLTKWVAASKIKAKKVAWVHTDMVNNDWPVKTGVFDSFEDEKQAYSRFDEVVTVSNIVKEGMLSNFGCKKVQTIYNLLDSRIKSKASLQVDFPFKASINLVAVGRLESVKGFDRLIDALGILKQRGIDDFSLTIVGDGSQRALLESRVLELNLQSQVSFTGAQSNPYPYMLNSDMFVCPSHQEGFNIAILEAMTLGLPVLATNSAGPAEILDNGKYGLLVENSVEGIVESLYLILNNKSLLDKYHEMSLLRCNDYSEEKQMEAINVILSK